MSKFEPLEDFDLHQQVRIPHNPTPKLPISGKLGDLSLAQELHDRYQEAKDYAYDCRTSGDVPPNQVAQVMNTTSAILKEIIKMQAEVHNMAKVQKMEEAIIGALKLAPTEVQDEYFANYERLLKL